MPVVCGWTHALLVLFVFCACVVVSGACPVVFWFVFCHLVLPVSLDCPIMIASSIFSNKVYSIKRLSKKTKVPNKSSQNPMSPMSPMSLLMIIILCRNCYFQQ